MASEICSARLADQETRCTRSARQGSSFCAVHISQRDQSVREYKLAGEQADTLRPQAVLSHGRLESLPAPAEVDAAIKATDAYLDAVKEEARLRTAHTKRFYADGPIDGHHRRVHVLQVKIEVGTRFVDQLRARKSRLEHEERVERSRRIALADSEERRRKDELERRIRLGQAEAEHRQRLLQEQWRRDELNRSRLRQQAAAAREWQQPPQRHYPYDAYDGGGGGPSLSSMFVKAAACYCAYKLFRAFIAGRSSHSDGHNAGLAAGGGIDFNAITRWLTRQVFAVKGHFSDLWQPVKDAAAGSVGAVHGVGDWILSNIKAVGDSLSQLAPHPVESEAVVQELAREAWSVAGSAMNGAQKLAENAAGEAQKLAENAVVEAQKLAVSSAADVGKRVQEGLGSDEVKQFKQLAKSLGIRW